MAANKRDFYEVLGVARTATEDEIKKAFRRMAKQYHPDANKEQGAEARFIEINEAYEVLSDPQKRAAYDRYGHAGLGNGAGAGAGFATDFGSFSTINDLFETFFAGTAGGTSRRTGPQRGADLRYELTITFEEAVFGCQKEIELPRWETCSHCRGNGAQPGTSTSRCSACQGTGEIRRVQQSIFGQFVNVTMCERCRGEGRVITTPCEKCRGQGRVRNNRRVVVNIPAGVDDGINVRVTGEGEVSARGGTPGNLYVVLTVKPHQFFKRQGNDIIYELPISFTQAALGDEVDVPTVDEKKTTLRIPAGTQSGRSFRLKGMGVPVVHSSARGDQHVIVKVVTPTSLTAEQKHLLEEFARLEQEQNEQNDKNIFRNLFEKTKDVFQ
ncbi:molecular chaperone DnaJ [Reticulibacter mediterranei]|jgi:molecular chaperone DnaJ|uniref:Chaperone protein DnaJ n=1 Tax=Reticulibacter mediterranei TaxID=2778369 RepID=A0A8J3MZT9_9CHLR|nr:molecular chaperone DnaJ [Reticulibacter mediterranei]GHO92257.1 molecular chaperone DnaJ [Reticulibacter mediterranei]